MSRWKWEFSAIDPHHFDRKWVTGIDVGLFNKLQKSGDERRLARLFLVREVLEESTDLIFRGWSRPECDDCFVYSGSPKTDRKSLSITTPPPVGMVFLVFVLRDGTIDEWTWRTSSSGDGMPDGVTGELIWPPKQNS